MDETNELNPDVRGRIDAHLDAIDAALSAAGMSRSERRSITDDVEAQVLEMLSSRAGPSPTLADAEAVLAELDSPEAYAREDVVSPPPAPPVPMPIPARPHFSRLAILGAIWAGLFLASLVPIALFWSFRSSQEVSSRPMRGPVRAQARRSVEITTRRVESASTQPGAVSPDETTPMWSPTTTEYTDEPEIQVTCPPAAEDQTSEAELSSPRTQGHTSIFGCFLFLPAILILGAPVGTTILGLVAISQIRRSAGRLYGLGLALFDAIIFPLLLLDVAIFGLWYGLLDSRVFSLALWVIIAVAGLTCMIVDYLLVRWAWRSVNKPHPASA